MKLFTARRNWNTDKDGHLVEDGSSYTCHCCGKPIMKGQKYAKKTVTLDSWVEINGHRMYEPYKFSAPVCETCANETSPR